MYWPVELKYMALLFLQPILGNNDYRCKYDDNYFPIFYQPYSFPGWIVTIRTRMADLNKNHFFLHSGHN